MIQRQRLLLSSVSFTPHWCVPLRLLFIILVVGADNSFVNQPMALKNYFHIYSLHKTIARLNFPHQTHRFHRIFHRTIIRASSAQHTPQFDKRITGALHSSMLTMHIHLHTVFTIQLRERNNSKELQGLS